MALPVALSAPLADRFSSIEALLHREGFSTGVLGAPLPPEAVGPLLDTLGHGGGPSPEGPVRVFSVPARRSIATGEGLPLLAAELALALEGCKAVLLGASAAQHPAAALAPRSDAAARAALALLGGGAGGGGASARREAAPAAGAGAGAGAGAAVDEEELFRFVFPHQQNHPRSTGRLIAFALHGPLRDGALAGGAQGRRLLTPRELNTLIDCIEAEDSRAAFAGGSALGAPLPRSCATPLPNISRAQLARLLAPLPRVGAGGAQQLPFAALQAAVLAAREARVADLRKLFPAPPSAAAAGARLLPAPALLGRGVLEGAVEASAAPLRATREAAAPGGGARDVWRKRTEIVRRREEVGLLHTRLTQVAHVWATGTSVLIPALLANVSLVRPAAARLDGGARPGVDAAADVHTRPGWEAAAPFALARSTGSRVPGARDFSRYLPQPRLDAPVLRNKF